MGRNGDIVAHYEYSPFGSLTKVSGDYADSNPLRFSSEYFDEETELVYYNYRYYNPELGRWISRDPIEEQGGFNLYCIIGNNPLLGWDRLGHGHAWWCLTQLLDNLGQSIKNTTQPFVDAYDTLKKYYEAAKEAHYGRNEFNHVPDTEADAENDGFKKLRDTQAVFHGAEEGNSKYVHDDGREAVYDSKGNLVTNPNTEGTYNFNHPTKEPIMHIINDVIPYYVHGNSPKDTTTFYERVSNSFVPLFL